MWGSWQMQKEERTFLLPSGLNLRPSKQASQNLTALITVRSLPAFFHFKTCCLVVFSTRE